MTLSKATQQARAGRQVAGMGRRTCAWEPESPRSKRDPNTPGSGTSGGASSAPHLCRCTSGSSASLVGPKFTCGRGRALRCRGSGRGSQSRCGGAQGPPTKQPCLGQTFLALPNLTSCCKAAVHKTQHTFPAL